MREFELVILRSTFELVVSELQFGSSRFATAKLTSNFHSSVCELIPRKMEFTNHVISGAELSSVSDWLLIEAAENQELINPESLIAASQLRRGQLLCVLQVGIGQDKAGWVGAVAQNGKLHPLSRIRLVGAAMPVIERSQSSDVTHTSPLDSAWLRLEPVIGSKALSKVHQSSVLLFGAGKIGSLMAQVLVMQGIRRLIIVDFDSLDDHNLFATFGARPSDLGINKAVVLTRFLNQLRPSCAIHAVQHSVNHPDVVELARGCDLIVDCVDNDTPRIAATMLSNNLLKPNLSLGTIVRRNDVDENLSEVPTEINESTSGLTHEIGADVKLLLPGTCAICAGGITDRSTAESDLSTSPDEQLHLRRVEWNRENRTGSLVSINILAVGAAIQFWFDLLTGHLETSIFQRFLWEQGIGLRTATTPLVGNPGCKYCSHLHVTSINGEETDADRLSRFIAISRNNS